MAGSVAVVSVDVDDGNSLETSSTEVGGNRCIVQIATAAEERRPAWRDPAPTDGACRARSLGREVGSRSSCRRQPLRRSRPFMIHQRVHRAEPDLGVNGRSAAKMTAAMLSRNRREEVGRDVGNARRL